MPKGHVILSFKSQVVD